MSKSTDVTTGSTIVGISVYESGDKTSTTLYVLSGFDPYFNNPESGRSCEGQKAESIYVGSYDCSDLEIGQTIKIFYGKAITTAKGTFQPVAMIRVLS